MKVRQRILPFILALSIILSLSGCKNQKAAETVGDTAGIRLPVIMYHGLTDSNKLRNKYMIPPQLFENDLSYLCEHGYTTITTADLISYFSNGKELPEKPVLLTFDDGYYNNYVYAFPLLKKYKCKALISPIGLSADEAENEKYRSPLWSQCKWSELREMFSSGLVEIGNHTFDLHKNEHGRMGAAKSKAESDEEYEKRLKEDILTANERIKKCTGSLPPVFVYPFGAKSEGTEEIIRSLGFEVILDCENKMNIINDKDDLLHLHRFLRPEDISSGDFFENKVGL